MANNTFSTPWLVFRKGDKTPKGSITAHPGAAFIVYFLKIRGEYDPVINLIKAAPDLLEACKETLGEMRAYNAESEFDESCPMKPTFDQLKAAIAKAEGKET